MIHGIHASSGEKLQPGFEPTSALERAEVMARAAAAFDTYRHLAPSLKAHFLRTIASELEALRTEIVERAHLETGLPLTRLNGELGRTTSQLHLFAELGEEGSWVDARIDPALPDRTPPRPDLRSMLCPIGVVGVFGASNFPLAFSVAGGDTASALAAGCPVVVKAHNSHPGTSRLAAQAIETAVQKCGLPEGVFSLVYGTDNSIGEWLVTHEVVQAVGFTGSQAGGLALQKLAQSRKVPIPVFAEMGSINPVVIFPGAMQEKEVQLAEGLFQSFTLGSGQFCTNPGMVFIPSGSEAFRGRLSELVQETTPFTMLTPGIREHYLHGVEQAQGQSGVHVLANGQAPGSAVVLEVPARALTPQVQQEVFGPCTVLCEYQDLSELQTALEGLEGQLTATLHAAKSDLTAAVPVLSLLEQKVGRVVFGGFPTGVEVCHSMVHGGPFPATTDPRSTSVGARAIERFCKLTCYQDCPNELLPPALQDGNPLLIRRLREGRLEFPPGSAVQEDLEATGSRS